MNKCFEDVVAEINHISEALEFISESIECHAAEGKDINLCGLAYLTRLLRGKSSSVAESCWEVCSDRGPVNYEASDS